MSVLSLGITAQNLQFVTYNASKTQTGYSELVDTAVSPDGLVMTVWCEVEASAPGQNRIVASIYNPQTKTSGPIIEVPGQFGDNLWPRVCAGEDGEFFVTWSQRPTSSESEHTRTILFSHFQNNAFSAPETVCSPDSDFPVIAYNEKKKVASVYWQLTFWNPIDIEQAVRHRSANGRWSDAITFSFNEMVSDRVEVAVPDQNGVEYAAFEQKTQIYPPAEIVEICYSNTRTGQWRSRPIMLTGNRVWTFQPKVAVSPNGREVYILWFVYPEYTYYGQYITYSSDADTEGTYSPVVRVAEGHDEHKFYDSGLVYHGDRFYFSYINDGHVKVSSCYQGKWSYSQTLDNSLNPRMVRMGSSPYAGLAVAWMKRDGTTPPEAMTAYVALPVASRISAIESASRHEFRQRSLFYHNNYNEVSWVNSEKNITEEKNLAAQFLLFRTEGNTFDYTTPYKTFLSSTPSAGFEIVEDNLRYHFTEKIAASELSKSYKYAIIAVDEKGTKSDPVIANLQ